MKKGELREAIKRLKAAVPPTNTCPTCGKPTYEVSINMAIQGDLDLIGYVDETCCFELHFLDKGKTTR